MTRIDITWAFVFWRQEVSDVALKVCPMCRKRGRAMGALRGL